MAHKFKQTGWMIMKRSWPVYVVSFVVVVTACSSMSRQAGADTPSRRLSSDLAYFENGFEGNVTVKGIHLEENIEAALEYFDGTTLQKGRVRVSNASGFVNLLVAAYEHEYNLRVTVNMEGDLPVLVSGKLQKEAQAFLQGSAQYRVYDVEKLKNEIQKTALDLKEYRAGKFNYKRLSDLLSLDDDIARAQAATFFRRNVSVFETLERWADLNVLQKAIEPTE